jgi:hypothetical protein
MTVMRLRVRKIFCDRCRACESLVTPQLRHKRTFRELPAGWVADKVPGKGIVILCSNCSTHPLPVQTCAALSE